MALLYLSGKRHGEGHVEQDEEDEGGQLLAKLMVVVSVRELVRVL